MAQHDFQDAEPDIANARGVLDSDAFRNQEKVTERINSDKQGYDFQVQCGSCGKSHVVMIPWPELIVAGLRIVPADMHSNLPWQEKGGFMYPPVRCGCNYPLFVPITPDKANRFVNTGISLQHLTEQGVQQYRQQTLARVPRR